jgi:uncharacterized protein (TIGR00251 family)
MPLPETRLTVAVRPRAGRDEIVGWQDAVLRVRVAAAPSGGAANAAVCALLASRLGCARTRVEIVRGHTARTKVVRIVGLAPVEATARLAGPGAAARPGPAARSA